MSNNKLVSIEIQKEFDVIKKDWQEQVFVKLYVAARTSGFLSEIPDRDWKTLCILATFMDTCGNCYPSQDEIAFALGVSRQTANERIKSLLEYTWQGKHVITMVKHRRKEAATGKKGQRWENNLYTILPISNLFFGKNDVTDEKPMSGNPDIGKSLEEVTEKPMSGNPDIGKVLENKEENLCRQYPMSGNPDTNNNKIFKRSVVVEGAVENCRVPNQAVRHEETALTRKGHETVKSGKTDVVENASVRNYQIPNTHESSADPYNTTRLQELAKNISGAIIPLKLLDNLVKEYSQEKVKEKIKLLGSLETKNAPGFLVAALRDNYVLTPGRPRQHVRTGLKTRSPAVDAEASKKKKEFIKSLYLS